MVDYSRFSKLAADLSDSEEEEEVRARSMRPKVTKYDKPTSITIPAAAPLEKQTASDRSPEGWQKWANTQQEEVVNKREFIEDEFIPPKEPIPSFDVKTAITSSKWENGADNGTFVWSQTADEIHIRVRCALGTKAKQVKVLLNTRANELSVMIQGEYVLKDCALLHAVWGSDEDKDHVASSFATEEERFQNAMQWEVEDFEPNKSRCVAIHLRKRAPATGVRVWWKTLFKSYPGEIPIDLANITGRSQHLAASSLATSEAWEAAHKEFTKRNNPQ